MQGERGDNILNRGRRGFHPGLTLMELVVAISLFVLVLALLGFPLFAAFGYLQKAIAQSEALRTGKRVMKQLTGELSDASVIFSIPPNGEWISFLPSDSSNAAFGNFAGSAVNVSLIRYSLVPDFPWIWDDYEGQTASSWVLLRPNYATVSSEFPLQHPDNYRYARHRFPFYAENAVNGKLNPYVLARYQESGLAYGSALNYALDGSYPLNQPDYQALTGEKRLAAVLQRKVRDELVAISPYGPEWDVSHFVVQPMRMTMEGLRRPATGSAVCTSLYSRYPLWAARSRDLDEYADNLLEYLYYPVVDTAWADSLSSLRGFIEEQYPLYRLYPVTADGPVASVNNTRNPFGYQVRVFRQDGALQFGFSSTKNTATNEMITTAVCNRHFMDWPPIDRPDLATPAGTEFIFDAGYLAQWKANVERQRVEGKLTFEQPYQPQREGNSLIDVAGSYYLPISTGAGWQQSLTYRVKPPRSITIDAKTYRLVDKDPAALAADEFCLRYRIDGLDTGRRHGNSIEIGSYDWCRRSREVVFGESPSSLDINASYTICDLQPTDTVVATYSTLGMLDIGLTLSREDRGAGRKNSRQDFAVNLRVEARNAMRRARQK